MGGIKHQIISNPYGWFIVIDLATLTFWSFMIRFYGSKYGIDMGVTDKMIVG